jgi:hypothetical protein
MLLSLNDIFIFENKIAEEKMQLDRQLICPLPGCCGMPLDI